MAKIIRYKGERYVKVDEESAIHELHQIQGLSDKFYKNVREMASKLKSEASRVTKSKSNDPALSDYLASTKAQLEKVCNEILRIADNRQREQEMTYSVAKGRIENSK